MNSNGVVSCLRKLLLCLSLTLITLSGFAQSSFDFNDNGEWTLSITIDQENDLLSFNYTSATGETLRVDKNYSDPKSWAKTYSINQGQASLELAKKGDDVVAESNDFVLTKTNKGQSIDYGVYQPLIEEYRKALAETQIKFGIDPYERINDISKYFDCNDGVQTRGALECSSAVFGFMAAGITEEIVCVAGLTPACSAAIAAAASAFTTMIAICSEDDDEDDDSDGDAGNGNGGSGGGTTGGGSTGPVVVIIIGGGGSGGGGGADCTFNCGEQGCSLTCYVH